MFYSIKKTYSLNATPQEVFQLLTDSKKIKDWSGQAGKVASKAGGAFSIFDGWVKGRVLVFVPGKKLSYTWRASEWPKDWADSEVTYDLVKTAVGTKILLEHSGLPNRKEMDGHKEGWDIYFFDLIKEYLEKK